MASNKKTAAQNTEYVRSYTDIRGVDFSEGNGKRSTSRLPYAENMYRDYSSGDYLLESVPGFRRLFKLPGKINAMFSHKAKDGTEYILVHSKDKLYRFALKDKDAGGTLTAIATLNDTRSAGFSYGGAFYIFDGGGIHIIDDDGTVSEVSDAGIHAPYVPTRYKDGKECEQKNLLTDKFTEEITINDYYDVTYGTAGLIYSPNSDGSFSVIGYEAQGAGEVYIPARIRIGDKYRDVTKIADLAFASNLQITALYTNDGLKEIGGSAFENCRNLKSVVLSDTVSSVGECVFKDCVNLTTLYIGAAQKHLGANFLEGCTRLEGIEYSGSQGRFTAIDGSEQIALPISCASRYRAAVLSFPVSSPAKSIERVEVNGVSYFFLCEYKDGLVTSVNIDVEDKDEMIGSRVIISGIADGESIEQSTDGDDIRDGAEGAAFSNGNAIKKCTKCAVFDGRIFLSGNPDLPNTVFFSSEKHPLYFGSLDFMNDGKSGHSVRAILPAQDNLIVFKSADDGNGSIFYHKKEKLSGLTRRVSYPARFANSGIPSLGDAVVFYDDALFISEMGLCALEKNSLGGVNAVCRSHNVNQRLLSEDFERVRFATWQGYLVLSAGGRMYLADSRHTFTHETGSREYEWFYLTGIGARKSLAQKYFYQSLSYGSYKKHELEDKEAPTDDLFAVDTFGKIPPAEAVGTYINGEVFYVRRSEEYKNRGIYECCELLGVGELLLFGCENGAVMVFNNDKRGEVPKRLTDLDASFDTEGYKKLLGQGISAEYYTFDGVAPRYVIKTGMDCCDIPYLEKNTTPASLTVKYKTFTDGKIFCECETDKQTAELDGGFPTGRLSFADINFSNMSFDGSDAPTAVCFKAPKRWIEKEITLSSGGFRSPMGIYGITYRFKINGRIKKR